MVAVEVNGRRVEVKIPGDLVAAARTGSGPKAKKPTKRDRGGSKVSAPTGNSLPAPMRGTIVKTAVADGDTVTEGQLILVLEAMKMEHTLTAPITGVVALAAKVGDKVAEGQTLARVTDENSMEQAN